ncbi:MAG: dTDP-4-dehydrorhamnose reductase [Brevinematia bacterium]
MKVLLIGAYGQLGTSFRKFFESNCIDYIPVSRTKRDDKTFVADISDCNKIYEIIRDGKFDLVVNCSAYNNVDKAEVEEYRIAWLTNTYGVSSLSVICRDFGIPIIHYSTDYVFDGSKKEPYVEEDKTLPVCRYGITKLCGEEFLRYNWEKHICLRVSWVFGKGETNFIKKLLNWAKGGVVRVSVDEVSSPTYTDDIVEASWKLYSSGAFGLYHFSSEGECSRYEYAKFVLETLNWRGQIIESEQAFFNLPARRPPYSKIDSSKLKGTISINIPHWKEAVYKYLKEEYGV